MNDRSESASKQEIMDELTPEQRSSFRRSQRIVWFLALVFFLAPTLLMIAFFVRFQSGMNSQKENPPSECLRKTHENEKENWLGEIKTDDGRLIWLTQRQNEVRLEVRDQSSCAILQN